MKKIYFLLALLVAGVAFTSCSDDYMEDLNTDTSKASFIDPNTQLTTGLLQTYGDFGMMDTYRSYITGFTQHFMGGWNVSNYAGSVLASNDQMRLVWDRLYGVGIKNIVDGIHNSEEYPNLNAALRIHKVYLISILTDIYGDVPCSEAGLGFIEGIANPKYDTQEEIYNYFFTELDACVKQLGTGTDRISGDVTSLASDVNAWKRYANSLRLRFAMRISDVNPTKAREEFEKALNAEGGYITNQAQDAYVIYMKAPFTLYDGSRDLDFRANALGEMLYGQDPESPTFICSTLFEQLQNTGDPRLYRICRHYINTHRSEIAPEGCYDVTDEVVAWEQASGTGPQPCMPGAAWWHNWPVVPDTTEIPTLLRLTREFPKAGYSENNYPARMARVWLALEFEAPDAPGILITSAEVEFLLAEAATKGWNVSGSAQSHYEKGIRASMAILNDYYKVPTITDDEINAFIAANPLGSNPKEAINTQAWILHMTNPSECWANLRRSDYPIIYDRALLPNYDFTYEDPNMHTPTRLKYPNLESKYNSENYKAAISRLGGEDDWHARMWWDAHEINYKGPSE